MVLTHVQWDRNTIGTAQKDHCDYATEYMGGVQPSYSTLQTLLRTRVYPFVRLNQTSVSTVNSLLWMDLTFQFVGWYDENGPGTLPLPTDTDDRIVVTGQLTPTHIPSPDHATTQFQVIWRPQEGVLQSYGRRKPTGTPASPGVFFGFCAVDSDITFAFSHASTLFQSGGYAEALWGS